MLLCHETIRCIPVTNIICLVNLINVAVSEEEALAKKKGLLMILRRNMLGLIEMVTKYFYLQQSRNKLKNIQLQKRLLNFYMTTGLPLLAVLTKQFATHSSELFGFH